MNSEVISVGTEILLGEITDTNASFIASQLPQFGIDLLYVSQVGDNPDRMLEVFSRAWNRSDLIFVTGGLGPTQDDITRETIAKVLGEEMAVDEEQERILRAMMERGGRKMPEQNIKQAMLIPSSSAIPNPRGTAPGWYVERDERRIIVMPGPPAEMTRMWEHEVVPRLEALADSILVSRTLKTTGLGESTVDEMMTPLLAGTNPSIGIYHRSDGVHARISAKAATREEAWRLIEPVDEEARKILGSHIWGMDGDTITAAVGTMLRDQRLTLGVMESATGGAIGNAVTDIAGSSDYFVGSLVVYSAQSKVDMGVPPEILAMHGVVSQQVAEAMAKAARERLHADLGIGITGIAGGDEVEGQPPGTMHLALWDGEEMRYSHSRYYQGRPVAKSRAVLQAMSLLREYLMARAESLAEA
ncbi:MAG: competence/damage-inducible protein A [Dehalococcoidia bacterium]